MIELEQEIIHNCLLVIFNHVPTVRIIDELKSILNEHYEEGFQHLNSLEEVLNDDLDEVDEQQIVESIDELALFFSEEIDAEKIQRKLFLSFLENLISETRTGHQASFTRYSEENLRNELLERLSGNSNIELSRNFGVLVNCCITETTMFSFRYDIPENIIRMFVEGISCHQRGSYRSGHLMCTIAFETVLKHHYEIRNGRSTFTVEYVDYEGNIQSNDRAISLKKLIIWAQRNLNPTNADYLDIFQRIRDNRNSVVHPEILEDISDYIDLSTTIRNDFISVFSVVVDFINNIYKSLDEL